MTTIRRGLVTATSLILGAALLAGCAAQSSTSTSSNSGGGGGPAAAPGFDPEAGTINVGLITALSGPVAPSAADIVAGQEAYFDKINAQGGVGGKYKIETVTGDSQYNPQLAVQTYQGMKDNVSMLSQVLGTPSVRALIPLLDQSQGIALAAQDADLRTAPSVLPFLASYQTDVVNAVSYLWNEEKVQGKNYCALVQDDSSGEARVEGLKSIGDALGFQVGTVTKFAPTDTNFTAQVQQLQSAGCDVVVFGGASNNTSNVVAAATQLQYTPTWIAEYFANSSAFPTSPIADYLEQNFVFTGPGDELDSAASPGMADLVENLKKSSPDAQLTLQHVYGWIQAQVVTAVLEQAAKDGDLSTAGIRKASTEVKTVDFGGLGGPVTLGQPEDRVLPKQTTIFHFDRTKPYGLAAASVLYQAPQGLSDSF
jgi:ABC-type branched-subunit amino acid transport system substrate-binding protein